MFEFLITMLLYAVVMVGLPVVGLVVAYKVACGFLAGFQGDREEAEAERKGAEADLLRLQMMRDKRARAVVSVRPEMPEPPPAKPLPAALANLLNPETSNGSE